MTLTVTEPQGKPDRIAERRAALALIRETCKRLGVTQEAIARAADVTRPLVVNVFAGRSVSARVVETARNLIAAAERRAARARARKREKAS